jgi:hypothetical protein
VMSLACFGAAQFLAHFFIDVTNLSNVYGLLPDTIFSSYRIRIPFRSNGIFLPEASSLSQVTALGILIEVLEFGRPGYLFVMALGFRCLTAGPGRWPY